MARPRVPGADPLQDPAQLKSIADSAPDVAGLLLRQGEMAVRPRFTISGQEYTAVRLQALIEAWAELNIVRLMGPAWTEAVMQALGAEVVRTGTQQRLRLVPFGPKKQTAVLWPCVCGNGDEVDETALAALLTPRQVAGSPGSSSGAAAVPAAANPGGGRVQSTPQSERQKARLAAEGHTDPRGEERGQCGWEHLLLAIAVVLLPWQLLFAWWSRRRRLAGQPCAPVLPLRIRGRRMAGKRAGRGPGAPQRPRLPVQCDEYRLEDLSDPKNGLVNAGDRDFVITSEVDGQRVVVARRYCNVAYRHLEKEACATRAELLATMYRDGKSVARSKGKDKHGQRMVIVGRRNAQGNTKAVFGPYEQGDLTKELLAKVRRQLDAEYTDIVWLEGRRGDLLARLLDSAQCARDVKDHMVPIQTTVGAASPFGAMSATGPQYDAELHVDNRDAGLSTIRHYQLPAKNGAPGPPLFFCVTAGLFYEARDGDLLIIETSIVPHCGRRQAPVHRLDVDPATSPPPPPQQQQQQQQQRQEQQQKGQQQEAQRRLTPGMYGTAAFTRMGVRKTRQCTSSIE